METKKQLERLENYKTFINEADSSSEYLIKAVKLYYVDPYGYLSYKGIGVHRLVMEEVLDRELKKGEIIHHINFRKYDNRPSNLCLCKSQAQHKKLETILHELVETLIEKDIIIFNHKEKCYEIR